MFLYGLPQPNRFWSAEAYRFGFNGVEKENTTYNNGTAGSGEGKMLAMDFRMYDARLGRWWGQDPIVNPTRSPYIGMGNNPVNYADPLGLIEESATANTSSSDNPSIPGEPPTGKGEHTTQPRVLPQGNETTIPSSSLDVMYIGEGETVDMGTRAADMNATSWNAQGWARNESYFWQEWKNTEIGKTALSSWNLENIENGRAPRVDKQWIETMPKHSKARIGEVIHHHHINNGRLATPVPSSLHIGKGYYKLLHSRIRRPGGVHQKPGIFKRLDLAIKKTLHGMGLLGDITEIIDIINDSPDAYNNIVYELDGAPISGFEVNKIYLYAPASVYLQITQKGQEYIIYDVYKAYTRDVDGTYIGIDYIKSQYEDSWYLGSFNRLNGERPPNEI